MDLGTITAGNPAKNATLAQGQVIVADILQEGLSANPRLYAVLGGLGGSLVPATIAQKNDDLPSWSEMNANGDTLEAENVPTDVPIYLQVFVAESGGGQGNFCDVADIVRYVGSGTLTLRQALQL